MKEYLIERAKEMSTWLGIIGLATAAGVTFSPDLQEAIINAGLAVASLVAVIFRERAK
jgi:hypothetical protein